MTTDRARSRIRPHDGMAGLGTHGRCIDQRSGPEKREGVVVHDAPVADQAFRRRCRREEVDLAPMRRTRREQGRVRPGSAGGFWLASGAACTHACEQAPRPGSLAACTSKAMAYEIEQAESTPNPWLG